MRIVKVQGGRVLSPLAFLLTICLAFTGAGCAHSPDMRYRDTDLVELHASLLLDIRYATADNFTGRRIYPSARAFLQREAADALLQADRLLRAKGYRLKIWDAYRPLSAQKILWSIMPDERFVANPKLGSMHNRGMAVDVTLTDLSGKDLPMPTAYDDFSEKAGRDYALLPEQAKRNRGLLRQAMEQAGFRGIPSEWWHFDYRGWQYYRVMDVQPGGAPVSKR